MAEDQDRVATDAEIAAFVRANMRAATHLYADVSSGAFLRGDGEANDSRYRKPLRIVADPPRRLTADRIAALAKYCARFTCQANVVAIQKSATETHLEFVCAAHARSDALWFGK